MQAVPAAVGIVPRQRSSSRQLDGNHCPAHPATARLACTNGLHPTVKACALPSQDSLLPIVILTCVDVLVWETKTGHILYI